jgi:glycosyltransferase involved in cell wall biosynthesis
MKSRKYGFFLDEIYYYDQKNNCYLSYLSSGNYLKQLNSKLNLHCSFIIPVNKISIIKNSCTCIPETQFNVVELPPWDSFVSFYKYVLNKKNRRNIMSIIDDITDIFDIFWIRLPSPFGIYLGEKAENKKKFVLYHICGDIRKAYLSNKYKGILKIIAKFAGHYFHEKTLKLGSNGIFLCSGFELFQLFKCYKKEAYLFTHSTISSNDLVIPKDNFTVPYRILYVGRINKEKGIFFLIDALKELTNKYKIELHVVGFGKDEELLNKILKKESFIKFYGFIPQGEQLFKVYDLCDIFVLPTMSTEGFPRVIYEAWAKGLYVISSKIGGIEGIGKNYDNLLFFQIGNKKELIDKLELIINNFQVRQKLKAGITKVQNTITSEYSIKLIERILESKKYI